MSEAIRCEGLTKRYGEILALDALDLEVPAGSIFGFLGRNGAGKTTTMRLLAGLAQPTEGKAWIGGVESTNGDNTVRGKFGYLPQDPAFYTWMTPREYLNYVGQLFAMPDAERRERVEEVLSRVGLKEAARRRIGGFSGGMHQRLGIAQALLHRPPILLLDEPTSALDPAGRHEILELLAALRGEVTVFFSSHILADVERICDTIAIIHQGRLVLVEARETLLQRYAINTALLEIDPATGPISPDFLEGLRAFPWVERVMLEEHSVRVVLRDVDTGRRALLPYVVGQGLLLNRYEWVRPTLEEIFLQVSA
ncbi:MAG: ABC transporter ATP-binding protein [Anaerolineae bacterium]|jgi:ABC-2 type transport system ATP-binding protein|nr:ABC transporter ATP-binding protein [Anaerolineae bacterium]